MVKKVPASTLLHALCKILGTDPETPAAIINTLRDLNDSGNPDDRGLILLCQCAIVGGGWGIKGLDPNNEIGNKAEASVYALIAMALSETDEE